MAKFVRKEPRGPEAARTSLLSLRESRGWSRRQLAEKAAISESRIYQAESGHATLGVEVATKAAKVLKVDPLVLMITTNVSAIKSRIVSGRDSPRRGASLARTLLQMLEEEDLSPYQESVARAGAIELAQLIEEAARGRGTLESLARQSGASGLDPPNRGIEDAAQRSLGTDGQSWSESYREAMDEMDRDLRGRRKPKRKPRKGGDSVDIDSDYLVESGEYPRAKKGESSGTTYEELGRDSFGRKLT